MLLSRAVAENIKDFQEAARSRRERSAGFQFFFANLYKTNFVNI